MVKKIPMRQCTGCGLKKPKAELIRVVKSPEGVISIDLKGKAAGRGAYICKDKKCLEASIKRKRLETCLETQIENEVYKTLQEELENAQ